MVEPTISNLHTIREAIVAAATLGTARRPFVPPAAPGALGSALAQLDPAAANEQTLLHAAALVLRFERAGFGAPEAPPSATPPAPPDHQPACAPAAAEHLRAMLGGSERAVLPEWLHLLAERGGRVPHHMLPELLTAGRNDAGLRPLVRAVIGARGPWLAAQNPDWHYASATAFSHDIAVGAVADEWQTGTRAARLALLETIRSTALDVARDLIASTWSSEKADDRAAFVATLGAGLSMADEPFLEAALDDRSSTVRKAAAELLARLPESRLAARMIERVAPLLVWNAPGGSRLFGLVRGKTGSIAVELPEACDKAMAHDGIDAPASAAPKEGLRARLLIAMLRVIPPAHWQARWQATPEAILAAAQAHPEQGSTLLHAWTDAARLHRDAAWADALLHADPSLNTLLPILPVERQEALLLDLLKRAGNGEEQTALFTLLRDTRHQWSAALARATLQHLTRASKHKPIHTQYTLWQTLNEAALRMPTALLPEVAALQIGSTDAQERWRDASERMLNTLHFRHDMEHALR